MDPMERARMLFEQALEHHGRQRLEAAEKLYRQALELIPDRISLLVNLSAVLIAQGRAEEALEYCQRALELEPGHPDASEHLAACRQAALEPAARLQLLERQLSQRPRDAGLLNNRGVLLHELGRHADALASFGLALGIEADNPGILTNRARTWEVMGEPTRAMEDYRHALQLDPDHEPAGVGFINAAIEAEFVPPAADPGYEALLATALERPWARPQSIAPLAQAYLGVASNDPARQVDLPVALLCNAVVTDPRLEQGLVRLRTSLLQQALAQPAPQPAASYSEVLHCALAMQCFLNEYVYAEPQGERDTMEELASRVSRALAGGEAVPASWLAAVACYVPLHTIGSADRLLGKDWPPHLHRLIQQQVAEPWAEQELRGTIPAITPIRDSVSVEVRKQYEQNPYPRWSKLPRDTVRTDLPAFLASRLAAPLPHKLPTASRGGIEALNAGCGTGQHPIDMVQRIEGLELLAVDLSLSSLAYAKRMAQALGTQGIEFAQADILELGSVGRSFDLIESTGVLHHLADPAQGLSVLAGLLREGGLMRLALYSERARQSVVAARQYIAERGYQPVAEDIRRLRGELAAFGLSDPRGEVAKFTDFYSMSECRDLLFHVQEHRFTLPGIQALLDRFSLEFAGFELGAREVAGFRRQHPQPEALRDLAAWDAHERQRPELFSGMYVFWVRKRQSPAGSR
ncbi:tetratricopeptide repeat protein [Luteimonas sp. JM171]|uniref:tetratricopeptide repeat protein n=1 Tax=Luteimonas sp. JM171 TaxID=1896164 RepID=UPI000AF039E8|nr:tetratricopeptide repeat protein [Luteimonas sp. JM171]